MMSQCLSADQRRALAMLARPRAVTAQRKGMSGMKESSKDPPLEVLQDGGCYVSQVVDLASVHIRLGRTPNRFKDFWRE
jgi:hypothetical protein